MSRNKISEQDSTKHLVLLAFAGIAVVVNVLAWIIAGGYSLLLIAGLA